MNYLLYSKLNGFSEATQHVLMKFTHLAIYISTCKKASILADEQK